MFYSFEADDISELIQEGPPDEVIVQSEQVRAPFYVDPTIINAWEKENNVEFTPNAMKKYINDNLAKMETWDLKKKDDLSYVKMKYGSDFNKS